jgi:hypothetical protein
MKKYIGQRLLVPLTGLTLAVTSVYPLHSKIKQLISERDFETSVRIPIGLFLKNHTTPNSRIYLEPIGIIGYYSQRYIYDDAGLISPQLVEFSKCGNDIVTRYRKILYSRPHYLVLRNRYLDDFYNLTSLNDDFAKVYLYRINYNYRGRDKGFTVFRDSSNENHKTVVNAVKGEEPNSNDQQ